MLCGVSPGHVLAGFPPGESCDGSRVGQVDERKVNLSLRAKFRRGEKLHNVWLPLACAVPHFHQTVILNATSHFSFNTSRSRLTLWMATIYQYKPVWEVFFTNLPSRGKKFSARRKLHWVNRWGSSTTLKWGLKKLASLPWAVTYKSNELNTIMYKFKVLLRTTHLHCHIHLQEHWGSLAVSPSAPQQRFTLDHNCRQLDPVKRPVPAHTHTREAKYYKALIDREQTLTCVRQRDAQVPVGFQARFCAIDCKMNWPVFCQW